jgi:hypothetical protein
VSQPRDAAYDLPRPDVYLAEKKAMGINLERNKQIPMDNQAIDVVYYSV